MSPSDNNLIGLQHSFTHCPVCCTECSCCSIGDYWLYEISSYSFTVKPSHTNFMNIYGRWQLVAWQLQKKGGGHILLGAERCVTWAGYGLWFPNYSIMVGWIGPPCDLRLHFSPTRTSYFPMAVLSSILLLLLFSVNWFLKCMVF